MDLLGDIPKSLRTMIDSIHGGDDSKQNLGGADIARGFLTADMLLAGLERESIGGIAISITGDSNQAARQAALELITNC